MGFNRGCQQQCVTDQLAEFTERGDPRKLQQAAPVNLARLRGSNPKVGTDMEDPRDLRNDDTHHEVNRQGGLRGTKRDLLRSAT